MKFFYLLTIFTFFDEIDALCPKRQNNAGEQHSARLVNQMLTEMDGISSNSQTVSATVFVMAATNRPDMLDPALTRPGRLDKTLYVGLPSEQGRLSILKALTHKMTDILSPELDLESISKNEKLTSFSGADLASLVREASMQAMYQDLDKCLKEKDHVFGQEQKFEKISLENFTQAMEKVRPSISKKDLLEYSSKK